VSVKLYIGARLQ